jgi:hypothetical protein
MIAQYTEFYFANMKTFRPLLVKKYLKALFGNILNCVFIIGQFST